MEIKKTIRYQLQKLYRDNVLPIRIAKKTKIFCIGRNKTGTTSLEKAAIDLGLVTNIQSEAEQLFKPYLERSFEKIIKHTRKAEFFQDIPFSLPYTYQILNHVYPTAKFILTERDSPEQWVESFINFQKEVNGKNGKLPSKEELLLNKRVYEGFAYWTKNDVFQTSDDNLYDRNKLLKHYINYNKEVKHYFRFKDNLLVINIAERDSYKKFCAFIGKKPLYKSFPWQNKTNLE